MKSVETLSNPYLSRSCVKGIFITELKRLCWVLSEELATKTAGRKELIEQYNNCAAEVNERYGKEVMVLKKN